jgi:hypothetical protein
MAFENRGANWLQAERMVSNPYFGRSMPGCGELVATIVELSSSGEADDE